ncbi:hypothetical protein [Streptomyces yangpuensis]|uniref:hypothetical protein n=1 Tax=Streptomyces yangpuensis TaxID=1648182 RepID=UPI0035D863FF
MQTEVFGGLKQGRRLAVLAAEHGAEEGRLLGVDRDGLSLTVPRTHVEVLDGGTEVKLGIWLTNTKSRRTKLDADQLKVLADLGLHWAR